MGRERRHRAGPAAPAPATAFLRRQARKDVLRSTRRHSRAVAEAEPAERGAIPTGPDRRWPIERDNPDRRVWR